MGTVDEHVDAINEGKNQLNAEYFGTARKSMAVEEITGRQGNEMRKVLAAVAAATDGEELLLDEEGGEDEDDQAPS
jgi:hypothetical protein